MEHQPVKSSNILSVGYDPETRKMEVKFVSGGHYCYEDVPPETHAALMSADSIGSHLAKHIRPKHSCVKVTE
jgi:hypothetical protein